jgi:pimeloyl-ACP methyl ester carboxylesterase
MTIIICFMPRIKRCRVHSAAMARKPVGPPRPTLQVLEQLSLLEYGTLCAAAPGLCLRRDADGGPVLVLPGFTASDDSTLALRTVLRRRGHAVHGWGLGRNVGPHPRTVDGMRRRLDALHRRYGTTVSVVGHSLGGVYARELARAEPEVVRQVITMGSPFRLRTGDRTSASWLYDLIRPKDDPFFDHAPPEEERPPLPMPVTAVYTRTDGVVRWSACIEGPGPRRQNVCVVGTHTGLAYNLGAVLTVLDRVAQPEGEWERFRPPVWAKALYRRAAVWRPDMAVPPVAPAGAGAAR